MENPIYIHLEAGAGPIRPGSSHWFGYPDLAHDVEVPWVCDGGEKYALTLICQINLADIAYYRGDWDEPAISMHVSDNRVCRVQFIPEERFPELEYARTGFMSRMSPRPSPSPSTIYVQH